MTRLHQLRSAIAGLVCVMLLAACAQSTPSRYYTLVDPEPAPVSNQDGPVVALASVTLPRYLDRPQIVTRLSQTQLKAAEFDRWIEPLPALVTGALAESLQERLAGSRVVPLPQKGPSPEFHYRIHVDITRFEAGPGDEAILAASWTIASGNDRKEIGSGNAVHRHSTGSGTYDEIVQALASSLGDLGTDIAAMLQSSDQPS